MVCQRSEKRVGFRRTQKRSGELDTETTDFQEHNDGDGVKTIQVSYVDEYGNPIDSSPEKEAIYQNLRELALSLFSEDSTDFKILEHLFYKNPSVPSSELAAELSISDRAVRKARKRIKEKIHTLKKNKSM